MFVAVTELKCTQSSRKSGVGLLIRFLSEFLPRDFTEILSFSLVEKYIAFNSADSVFK